MHPMLYSIGAVPRAQSAPCIRGKVWQCYRIWVLPHFPYCPDGNVFSKPLNKLTILYVRWKDLHAEPKRPHHRKLFHNVSGLQFLTGNKQHGKCGRTQYSLSQPKVPNGLDIHLIPR